MPATSAHAHIGAGPEPAASQPSVHSSTGSAASLSHYAAQNTPAHPPTAPPPPITSPADGRPEEEAELATLLASAMAALPNSSGSKQGSTQSPAKPDAALRTLARAVLEEGNAAAVKDALKACRMLLIVLVLSNYALRAPECYLQPVFFPWRGATRSGMFIFHAGLPLLFDGLRCLLRWLSLHSHRTRVLMHGQDSEIAHRIRTAMERQRQMSLPLALLHISSSHDNLPGFLKVPPCTLLHTCCTWMQPCTLLLLASAS